MARDDGQSLVELAMVLPMLLVVILGVYGFGSFFAKYQTITSATTAAARFEATCRTQTTGSAHATGQAAASSLSNVSFTFKLFGTNTDEPDGATCSIPDGTKVTVNGSADSFTINLGFYRFTLPVSSSVTVVVE